MIPGTHGVPGTYVRTVVFSDSHLHARGYRCTVCSVLALSMPYGLRSRVAVLVAVLYKAATGDAACEQCQLGREPRCQPYARCCGRIEQSPTKYMKQASPLCDTVYTAVLVGARYGILQAYRMLALGIFQ